MSADKKSKPEPNEVQAEAPEQPQAKPEPAIPHPFGMRILAGKPTPRETKK